MPRHLPTLALTMLVVLLGTLSVATVAEEPVFEGSVEILYRNVSQDGSTRKYDEDFDGLDSGARLSNLSTSWTRIESGLIDYLRLEASGLGGEPYERTQLRLGRTNVYDLRIGHRKQTYLYDLFGLVDDQDGSVWDSERSLTDVDLTWHVSERSELFFGFQQVQRDGRSLFMKSIERDLFLLETPLDQQVKRYSVGGRFRLGDADLLVEHTLQRYDYRFDNTTFGNAGLSLTDPTSLNAYRWRQNDDGDADITTLSLNLPMGDRIHLSATVIGTLLGENDVTSRVSLDADGTSFTGAPFSVSDGFSRSDIEADHLLLDTDLTVTLAETLDFHLQVRSLDREIESEQLRDLDGNGTIDDTEGTINDTVPGSETRVDYALDSITGLFEYSPSRKVRLRAGYRTIDRELERSGFEFGSSGFRNVDYESDDDDTVLLGFVLRPVDWLRVNADYEEGDVSQALNATAPTEIDRLRAAARLQPTSDLRVDLSYLDYEHTNDGRDFRQNGDCSAPGADVDDGCWASSVEGTTMAVSLSHQAGDDVDYWLRWSQQDVDSVIRASFDTNFFFGSTENGDSIYDTKSTQWAGQVNFSWDEPWRGFVRLLVNESDGDNDVAAVTFRNSELIDQDYLDCEAGLTYTFPGSFYLGGRFRVFDYDDANSRLDYDGQLFSIVAGLTF